jgi:hypothetical protein
LGIVLSTAYAALFHLWNKREVPTLRHYLLAAWLGFAVGHLAGDILQIHWIQVGQLNIVSGTIGAAIAMLIARSLEA